LSVAGATTLSGTLNVVGAANLQSSANVGGTLRVVGAANVLSTFGVTGAANVLSTFGVTGATTLLSTLSVTGSANVLSTFGISGAANAFGTFGVAGVTTLSSNVATAGTILINSVAHQFANNYTFNNSSVAANVDTVSASLYRSYEYTVQLSDATTTPARFQLTKILLVHDGSTPYLTEYGTIFNSSQMGLFDAIINGGNIALQLTPTSANVVVRFVRTSIV
jgi:hypothetical protein